MMLVSIVPEAPLVACEEVTLRWASSAVGMEPIAADRQHYVASERFRSCDFRNQIVQLTYL